MTKRTWGIPCESRRVTPIWEGVKPLRASFPIWSTTSSGVVFSHEGGARRYGRAEDAECPYEIFEALGKNRIILTNTLSGSVHTTHFDAIQQLKTSAGVALLSRPVACKMQRVLRATIKYIEITYEFVSVELRKDLRVVLTISYRIYIRHYILRSTAFVA